jgi:hypothetical protein
VTALRVLVTVGLLMGPFALVALATVRSNRNNLLWLMFPIVLGLPTTLGALLVFAPLEAWLDARGQARVANVALPAAGAAIVLCVMGRAWWTGRGRRRGTQRAQLLTFAGGAAAGALWGATWRASEWISRRLLA